MGVRRTRRFAVGALTGAVTLTLATVGATFANASNPAEPADAMQHRTMDVQVLALNDFHGNLAPNPADSSSGNVNGTPAGGAEYLATHLAKLRSKAKYSTTVAAGDLIGASPLLSAAFHDEPTIEALSDMGLSAASVGNHEFDEGWKELLRLQDGGCLDDGDGKNNQNSCPDENEPFQGAAFDYLSANVFHEDTDKTLFAPYVVQRFGPAKVAFVGMTLEDTPNIVTKEGVEGLEFTDEIETANALVPKLKEQGVESIVVLLHEGGFPVDETKFDKCPGVSGPVVNINKGLDPEIDAVISGHTHQGYNCTFADPNGKPRKVTSASSYGKLVTEMTLTIDRRTKDVVREKSAATNRIVTRDVSEDKGISALIAKYNEFVEPIANRVIGHLTTDSVTATADDSHESPLGNLIADSMLADPSVVTGGKKPQIAFMNPGGIRADLEAPGGEVTFGNAFTVQPFNNYLVSMDLTGAQLLKLLDEQWTGDNAGGSDSWNVLQVAGLSYTWTTMSDGQPAVVERTVEVGGEPLDPEASYRVVTNSFLAGGGDGFPTFPEAADPYYGGLDIDALAAYLAQNDPYTPVETERIDVD